MTLTFEIPVVKPVWMTVYGIFGALVPLILCLLSCNYKEVRPGLRFKRILAGALFVVPLYLAYCYLINIHIEPLMKPYVASWGGYVVGPSRQEEGRHTMAHLLRGLGVIVVLVINVPFMATLLSGFVRAKSMHPMDCWEPFPDRD